MYWTQLAKVSVKTAMNHQFPRKQWNFLTKCVPISLSPWFLVRVIKSLSYCHLCWGIADLISLSWNLAIKHLNWIMRTRLNTTFIRTLPISLLILHFETKSLEYHRSGTRSRCVIPRQLSCPSSPWESNTERNVGVSCIHHAHTNFGINLASFQMLIN
jgi:hypothetical protein